MKKENNAISVLKSLAQKSKNSIENVEKTRKIVNVSNNTDERRKQGTDSQYINPSAYKSTSVTTRKFSVYSSLNILNKNSDLFKSTRNSLSTIVKTIYSPNEIKELMEQTNSTNFESLIYKIEKALKGKNNQVAIKGVASNITKFVKQLKEKENIDFLYHNLRHTYATNCALNNVNLQWLMSALGHKKIETTRRYYINADNETLRKKTLRIIDEMYDFHDRMVEFDYGQPDYYETISSRGGKTRYPVEKPIRGKPRIDNPAADMLREYGKRRAAELQQQPQVEPSQTKKKRK